MAMYLANEAQEIAIEPGYESDEIPFTSSRRRARARPVIRSTSSDESDIEGDLEGTTNGEVTALQEISEARSSSNHEQIGEQTNVEKILAELKNNNSMISALTEKTKRTEQRIKAIEVQLQSSISNSPNTTPHRPKKRDVPDQVRVSHLNA